MRIDREAFLVALAALAGCERADALIPTPSHAEAPTAEQRPGTSYAREPAPTPEPPPTKTPAQPVADVTPAPVAAEPVVSPAPTQAVRRHHRLSAKQWFLGLTMEQRSDVTSVCERRAATACWKSLERMRPRERDDEGAVDPAAPGEPEAAPEQDPEEVKVASLAQDKLAAYCKEEVPAPSCETPLVVAFDAQPIAFTAASRETFAFVPGDPAATDWPTAVTPWIALDLDGDGAITSGAELFGSSTLLASGTRAANGFAAIAELDRNRDGTLDARDPMFGRLVLWSDRNADRRSTPEELSPLAATVTAIPLSYSSEPRCNQRDDCEGERGTLQWRDSAGTDHVGSVVDIYIPR